eukprot:gene1002-biopygen853
MKRFGEATEVAEAALFLASDASSFTTGTVHDDLGKTAHPNAPWLEARPGPDGKPALDVLIVGAGQSGLAIGFGLLRSQ